VLSRKGFDSSFGGAASPIMPDGSLWSMPIPSEKDALRYKHVHAEEVDLGSVVSALTKGRITGSNRVHLDPDLWEGARPRSLGWLPAFGQAGSAQAHLENQGVGIGDLFLFFGWFQQTVITEGCLAFKPGSPDLHVLFGWLQVGEIYKPTAKPGSSPDWAQHHPHVEGASVREANNTLYVATQQLQLPGLHVDLPGGGVFRQFSPELQLTEEGAKRSLWRLPSCFYPDEGELPLSYHSKLSRWHRDEDGVLLDSVARGQEFVLDCVQYPDAVEWAHGLFG